MHIGRLIRTLGYLKPSQVYWRARYTFERRTGWNRVPAVPGPVARWDAEALARLREFSVQWGVLDARAHLRAAKFRAGHFEFVNDPADFSGGVDWRSAGRWRLWRYQLHYFDCVKELALAPADGDAQLARGWMGDWIAKNPPVTDVAWDAFTISARLLNWALAAAVFGIEDEAIRRSYLHQARFLATHLELDVLANHLLKNACGLCIAGALLDPALLEQGLKLLREQLEEQILSDGGHYERAPMYHALVLEDLLVVQAALGARGEFLHPYFARMSAFLEGILHPDGEIPFFGDAVFGEARVPEVLLALAHHERMADPPRQVAFPDSGFYVMRDDARRMHLIVKAGPPGPTHQLGHAHADCLSFELSVDGERVIVNSGTHGYADSPHRAYCRSEAAHNTFEITGKPQLELWGAFRVGSRYAVEIAPRFGATDAGLSFSAFLLREEQRPFFADEKDYEADIELTPYRVFEFSPSSVTVMSSCGGTRRKMASRIHLAPGLAWQLRGGEYHAIKEGRSILIVKNGCYVIGHAVLPVPSTIEENHFFPEFGTSLSSSCLVFSNGSSEPLSGYEIRVP